MPIETATEPSFGSLQRQMQHLMEQMQKNFFNFCPSETWTPCVNLYESDLAYIICVDLAGVDKDKIELVVADQRLRLRGTRVVPTHFEPDPGQSAPRCRVHLMEIDHGSFSREVELPSNVDQEKITASHKNGLLWIELPKT